MKNTYDANILTYCQWRDDLTMQQSPFCHVDNLIFCCLSYMNWDGIADGFTPSESISLRDAANRWESRPATEQKCRVEMDKTLLRETAASQRFGEIRLFRYAEQFSDIRQQQFSAVTFLLDSDTVYVAFRGTDDTLTGWREDFNLSFLPQVPSQEAAAAYLRSVLSLGFSNVYVGGHSKGGNLAVYAAVHASPQDYPRICGIYNNDGPGFVTDLFAGAQFQQLQERVHTFVPQASVVGMLLEHDEAYQVVCSTQKGILQHDPYSWCVIRNDWFYLDDTTEGSKLMDSSLRQWILGMQPEEREKLTDAIFYVLQSQTNAHTIQDLVDGGAGTLTGVLHAWTDMPPETRRFMQKMLGELLRTVGQLAAAKKRAELSEKPLLSASHHEETETNDV